MDPFTIAAIIAGVTALAGSAVTAVVGAGEGKKTRELAEKQVNELKSLLDKIQSPTWQGALTPQEIKQLTDLPKIGEFIANSEQPVMARFMAAVPSFTSTLITVNDGVREYIAELPPSLATLVLEASPKVASAMYERMPEVANFYAEQSPTVAKFIADEKPEVIKADSKDATFARDAQRNALQQLSKVGTEGDTVAQSELMRGMNRLASQEAGQRGALTEEMARRGQLSSGRELLMKLAGQQASGQQSTELQMGVFEDAQRRRLEALSQAGSLGSKMFDQDVAIERDNASIINAFNMRNTDSMRRIEENRVNAENARLARDAQARQAFEQQRVMDMNQWQQREIAAGRRLEELTTAEYNAWQARQASQANQINLANASIANQANLANMATSADISKTNAAAINRWRADETEAQRRYQETLNKQERYDAEQKANRTIAERDRLDELAQRDYNNEMARLSHISGVQQTEMGARQSQASSNIAAGTAVGEGVAKAGGAAADWIYNEKKGY